MPQSGYIYILINPTLNGLVKIGKTSKTPEERAKELSSATGVPTQFMVAYDEFFEDIDLAENHVHEVLKNMGHHIFPNKEFFDIPLKKAIEIIGNVKTEFLKNNHNKGEFITEEKLDDEELDDRYDYEQEKKPYHDLLVEAKNFFYGLGDYMRDIEKAVELFDKAADLGSGEASYELGYIVNYGIDVKINKRLALKFLQNGVENNYLRCYLLMAEIYFDIYQPDNSEKCINKYFEKLKNLEEADKLELLEEYLNNQLENNREINLGKIKDYKQELMIYFEDSVQYSIKRLEEHKLANDEIFMELEKERLEMKLVIIDLLKKN